MPGIYIHIPFCRQACHYCDFHFSTSLKNSKRIIDAMHREMDGRSNFFEPGTTVDSIYFGGGTPSLLEPAAIGEFITQCHEHSEISPSAEVTLEANPDDLTRPRIDAWLDMGVNRLSIGVQSFRQQDLKLMNRSHDAPQASEGLLHAREGGFGNFSLDLIYGVPGQPMEVWKKNVERAISSGATHISAYCLTIEPRTVFANWQRRGKLTPVDENAALAQLDVLRKMLTDAGFVHYEVSNFARPNHQALHNSSYWRGEPYLGIGPSAHSFRGMERRWNIAHNIRYARLVSEESPALFQSEALTTADRWNELIMTGLRTRQGVDMCALQRLAGTSIQQAFPREWRQHRADLVIEDQQLSLAPTSWKRADGIASDFFMVEG